MKGTPITKGQVSQMKQLRAMGYTAKEIGKKLGLGESSVHHHLPGGGFRKIKPIKDRAKPKVKAKPKAKVDKVNYGLSCNKETYDYFVQLAEKKGMTKKQAVNFFVKKHTRRWWQL